MNSKIKKSGAILLQLTFLLVALTTSIAMTRVPEGGVDPEPSPTPKVATPEPPSQTANLTRSTGDTLDPGKISSDAGRLQVRIGIGSQQNRDHENVSHSADPLLRLETGRTGLQYVSENNPIQVRLPARLGTGAIQVSGTVHVSSPSNSSAHGYGESKWVAESSPKCETSAQTIAGNNPDACLPQPKPTPSPPSSPVSNALPLTVSGEFTWTPLGILLTDASGHQEIIHHTAQVTGIPQGNTLAYLHTFPDVTDRFTVHSDGLKHEVIFTSPRALAPNAPVKDQFLDYQGVATLSPNLAIYADGIKQEGSFTTTSALELRDSSGEPIFYLPPVVAYEQANPLNRARGRYSVRRTAENLWLSFGVSYTWLADPKREYPVVIDPTVYIWPPEQDALIWSSYPYYNYGDYPELWVGDSFRSLIQWDLSSLPERAMVDFSEALLRLVDNDGTDMNVSAHALTQSWTESEVTWNNRTGTIAWSTPGGDFDSSAEDIVSVGTVTDTLHSWTLSDLVAEWYNGNQTNYGILLQPGGASASAIKMFGSKEIDGWKPELDVYYTQGPISLSPYEPLARRVPSPDWYNFTRRSFWNAVAIRPLETADYDLLLSSTDQYADILASSAYGSRTIDFVLIDGNHAPLGNYYPSVQQYSGRGAYNIEYATHTADLGVGEAGPYTMMSNNVARVWDVHLTGGTTYYFGVKPTAGYAALSVALYKSQAGNAATWYQGRSDSVAFANQTGPGGTAFFSYTAPETDRYGLVVLNNTSPGNTLENFANSWDSATIGLVYNPDSDSVRYAHESNPNPTIYDVDYQMPHDLLHSISLSAMNTGWPVTLDNRDGAGYDHTLGHYFLPDYNGDTTNADDNIVEIDDVGHILNAWETDEASNDSYDGSSIDTIIDIAIVPGSPTRYFVAAASDGSVVYEIDLIKAGQFVPSTWGTIATCTVPGLVDNVGIDYDAQNGVLYHSDGESINIVVTDLNCNVLDAFICPSPAGFNSGVTAIEGKSPPEVWVTDYLSESTTRCEAAGQPPLATSYMIYVDTTPPSGSFEINDGDAYANNFNVTLNSSATDSQTGIAGMRFRNVPSQKNALVLQDSYPWGTDSIQQILAANDIPYDQLASSAIPTVDLEPYSMVIIPSVQGDGFCNLYNSNLTKFETYVQNGGTLELHGATFTSNTCRPTLPGSGVNNQDLQNYNSVASPTHPLMAAVPNPFYGNYASHNSFTGYPANTTVLATAGSTPGGDATLIEYPLGSGKVIASGQTLEWGWYFNQSTGTILANAIRYAADQLPWSAATPWVLSPPDGVKTVYGEFRNNAGMWSTVREDSITLDTLPPTASASCPPETSERSFTVSWTGSDSTSGINAYDVQYRVGAGGAWTTWMASTTAMSASFGPSSPVTVRADQTYYFRARAHDRAGNTGTYATGNGDCSTYVESLEHYVYAPVVMRNWPPLPTSPTLYTISNPEGDGSYTVSWSMVGLATSYVLEEAKNAAFTDAVEIYTGPSTSHAVSGRGAARYYYRVKARNSWGDSPWSNVQWVDVLQEHEPNDSYGNANGPLVSGLTYFGTFYGAADSDDYFYFDLSTAGGAELFLSHIPAGHNYDLLLIDSYGVTKGYSGNTGNSDEHIPRTPLAAGRYYIRIFNRSGTGSTQSYHLRVIYP